MLDTSADEGWLATTLRIVHLMQMIVQGQWFNESTLLALPNVQLKHLVNFRMPISDNRGQITIGSSNIKCLPELMNAVDGRYEILEAMLKDQMSRNQIEQILQTLNQLPLIQVAISLKEAEMRHVSIPIPNQNRDGRIPDSDWILVTADQEYMLSIQLTRLNKIKRRDTRAFPSRFPKPKDEGWVLVLADVETREVVALKRSSYVKIHTTAQLSFVSPETRGRFIYTLYILSDSYLGLDQQYDIYLQVELPSSDRNNMESVDDLG
jgi:activating signal cointegrator complex subunit 3